MKVFTFVFTRAILVLDLFTLCAATLNTNGLIKTSEIFTTTRITAHSLQRFNIVSSRLHASVGRPPGKFPSIVASLTPSTTPTEFINLVTPALGPHNFTFFAQFNHTAGLPVYRLPITSNNINYSRGILRVLIGNPLIAETMLKFDLTAGLALPVGLLLLEMMDRKGTEVVYELPSSLVVASSKSQGLKNAAMALDLALEKLVDYLVL